MGFIQLPLPSNYFLQGRDDSFGGQNFTANKVQQRYWRICPILRLIKKRYITRISSILITSRSFVINSCSEGDVGDGSNVQDIWNLMWEVQLEIRWKKNSMYQTKYNINGSVQNLGITFSFWQSAQCVVHLCQMFHRVFGKEIMYGVLGCEQSKC